MEQLTKQQPQSSIFSLECLQVLQEKSNEKEYETQNPVIQLLNNELVLSFTGCCSCQPILEMYFSVFLIVVIKFDKYLNTILKNLFFLVSGK